jgi:hypothetical protein
MWGRLQADVDIKLRRGAWYKVLKVQGLDAILEVNKQPRAVLKALLELSKRPPIRWSVVPTPKTARRTPLKPGDRYGVCPSCNERSILPRRAERHTCPRCRRDYAIAWDEPYLGPV